MTALRLALLEIGRFRGQKIRYMAMVMLAAIPLLYGSLYLWSNWDPYGKMDQVPVAVVNEDEGAELDGKRLNAGKEFAGQLKSARAFDWNFVSAQKARSGMDSGDYYFAIEVPADFSVKLATLSTTHPERADLGVRLDDANGYVAGIMASTAKTEIQNQINTAVYVTFAKTMFGDLSELDDGLNDAADGAGRLADGAGTAEDGANQLADGLGELESGSARVADGVGQIDDAVKQNADPLVNSLDTVQTGSQLGADLNETLAGVDSEDLERLCAVAPRSEVCQRLQGAVSDAKRQRDDIATLNDSVQGLTPEKINEGVAQLDRLSDGADAVAEGTRQAHDGAAELAEGNGRLAEGAGKLSEGLDSAADRVPSMDSKQNADAADVLGTPVSMSQDNRHPAGNYGRGLTPFFFAIALWVFGMVAYLLLRVVNPRALAGSARALTVALAGWLPAFLMGALGTVVLFATIDIGLGLDPVNLPGAVGLCLLAIGVFTAMAHFLRLRLGTAGNTAILILLMLQLTSSGGLYPMETTPGFFQAIHPFLPMSYLVDGLRITISGGYEPHLWRDVAVLTAFGVAAVTASTWEVMRRRRWTMARLRPAITF